MTVASFRATRSPRSRTPPCRTQPAGIRRRRHHPAAPTPAPALNLVQTAADTPRTAALNDPDPVPGAQPSANRGKYTAHGTTQRLRIVMGRVRRLPGCERGSVSDAMAMPHRTGHRHSAGKPPGLRLSKPPFAEDPDRLRLPSPGSAHLSPGSAHLSPGSAQLSPGSAQLSPGSAQLSLSSVRRR